MTKMPKQYLILVLVLLLYCWPWQLFTGDKPADWLASVITMQIAFVIFCNKFVRDNWILPVIIIEAVCAIFNTAYLIVPSVMSDIHEYIILSALIMELLIIITSMRATGGRIDSYNASLASHSLWRVRGGVFSLYNNKENS